MQRFKVLTGRGRFWSLLKCCWFFHLNSQKTEKSGQQKLEVGKGNILWRFIVLGGMNNLFLGKYTVYNLKICIWNHCFDKLQQEIFYVLGNFGRENNNLEYSIEVVLKGSFRTSKAGIHQPPKQNLWGWGGSSLCFNKLFRWFWYSKSSRSSALQWCTNYCLFFF